MGLENLGHGMQGKFEGPLVDLSWKLSRFDPALVTAFIGMRTLGYAFGGSAEVILALADQAGAQVLEGLQALRQVTQVGFALEHIDRLQGQAMGLGVEVGSGSAATARSLSPASSSAFCCSAVTLASIYAFKRSLAALASTWDRRHRLPT